MMQLPTPTMALVHSLRDDCDDGDATTETMSCRYVLVRAPQLDAVDGGILFGMSRTQPLVS